MPGGVVADRIDGDPVGDIELVVVLLQRTQDHGVADAGGQHVIDLRAQPVISACTTTRFEGELVEECGRFNRLACRADTLGDRPPSPSWRNSTSVLGLSVLRHSLAASHRLRRKVSTVSTRYFAVLPPDFLRPASTPAADTTEGAAPPVPEGAVMVTLKSFGIMSVGYRSKTAHESRRLSRVFRTSSRVIVPFL